MVLLNHKVSSQTCNRNGTILEWSSVFPKSKMETYVCQMLLEQEAFISFFNKRDSFETSVFGGILVKAMFTYYSLSHSPEH